MLRAPRSPVAFLAEVAPPLGIEGIPFGFVRETLSKACGHKSNTVLEQVSCPTKLTVALADDVHLLLLINLHSGTQDLNRTQRLLPAGRTRHTRPKERSTYSKNEIPVDECGWPSAVRAGGEHGSGGADLSHQLRFGVRFLPRLPRHGSERKGSTEMVGGASGSVKTVAMPFFVPPCTEEQYCQCKLHSEGWGLSRKGCEF
ncbi:hypothetical protein BHM03_00035778 [Ensete ventricosum]|nr:hypothetical protein BHM03_00035778 [Ensete ventricosum]